MMKDKGVIIAGALLVAISLSSFAAERTDLPSCGQYALDESDSSAQSRPNIIFFITDDYGWQDTSEPMWKEQTDLNKTFRTPNMERLADRGVKFTNAYTSCSVCSASRISILTGQNPVRHGTTFITGTPGRHTKTMRSAMQDLDGIQEGDVLLPALLREAGYRTLCIGKSHFGSVDSFGADPLNLGFDRKHYANHHGSPIGKSCGGRDAYHVERDGQQVHLTEALTLEAKAEISAAVNDGKPFFLYLSHYAIHTPILEDPRFSNNYPNLEGKQRAYATLIEGADKSLGDVMDHVESLGIGKNTLFIWTADNGGLTNNAPLRGLKNDAYEGGHRVPNIVAWGAQDPASQWQRHMPLAPGRVDHRPYIHTDWTPTLLRLAGAAHPKPELLDGYDITDLLSGRKEVARPDLFFWHEPNFWAHSGPESSIREGKWKLIYLYNKSAWELYDLTQDMGERTNQASQHPEVVNRLARKLVEHLEENDANYPMDVATGRELPPRLTTTPTNGAANQNDLSVQSRFTPEHPDSLSRKNRISASASSSHPEYPPSLAVDGDPATLWHSEWRDANAAFPITFSLDLQRPIELVGLRLRNRAGNQNGRIRDFRIDVSLDSEQWRPCGEWSLPDSPAAKSAEFETPVEGRYVRISALSSHAGPVFASLAEIQPIPADSGDLRDLGIAPDLADKPNIVWIMAEDISTELACYGHPAVKTPNLDALARQGARYTQAFCTAPSCTPSRNAMMTGVYQTRTDTQDQRRRGVILPEGMKPITHLLRAAGYYTALGCGYSTKTDLNFEAEPLFDGKDWSERKMGQPFFAQITLGISHRQPGKGWGPVRDASEHPVKLDDVELPPYFPDHPACRLDWAEYLDSIEEVDSQVAAILERLKTEGIEDNTILIFIGDNGRCHLRGKCWLYDGGIHVPLIMRWPGVIKPGTVNDDMVSMIDISATILDIAGAELPAYLDGHPILGEKAKSRDHIFAARDLVDEVMDHIRCVRTKQFKYIRNYTPENGYRECKYVQNNRPMLAVIKDLHARGELTETQQLILAETKPREELYDLQNDPHELNNLAQSAKHQTTLTALRTLLDQWIADTEDKGLGAAGPRPKRAAARNTSLKFVD